MLSWKTRCSPVGWWHPACSSCIHRNSAFHHLPEAYDTCQKPGTIAWLLLRQIPPYALAAQCWSATPSPWQPAEGGRFLEFALWKERCRLSYHKCVLYSLWRKLENLAPELRWKIPLVALLGWAAKARCSPAPGIQLALGLRFPPSSAACHWHIQIREQQCTQVTKKTFS